MFLWYSNGCSNSPLLNATSRLYVLSVTNPYLKENGERPASVRGNQRLLVAVVEVGTFAVMGIHTSPRAAETELDALVPAYEATAIALDVSVSQHRGRPCVVEN